METKNNLLIFFGEYRTFEVIIPQLKQLDDCDIIFSTWNKKSDWSHYTPQTPYAIKTTITEEQIKNIIPNCKVILTEEDDFTYNQNNTQKMIFHWKTAINSIKNNLIYDRIILHRCDTISTFHLFLEKEFKNDVLYVDVGPKDENGFWVNDYVFAGTYNIVKKFVETLNYTECTLTHYSIGNSIIKNNINYFNFIELFNSNEFKIDIVRDNHVDFVKNLNKKNKKLIDCPFDSKEYLEFTSLSKT